MSWWESDPRYGAKGWTLIWPTQGQPYFVKVAPKKRRARPRALRFADLKAGDVLVHRQKAVTVKRPREADLVAANEIEEVNRFASFCIVEHRWFDPCAGHDDRWAGEMAGVCSINHNGKVPTPYPHTLRGLAMQGFHYATAEQAERVRAFIEERELLIAAFDTGLLTREEALLRSTPYRDLVRDLAA